MKFLVKLCARFFYSIVLLFKVQSLHEKNVLYGKQNYCSCLYFLLTGTVLINEIELNDAGGYKKIKITD